MADKQVWEEIVGEVDDLYEHHKDGLADFTKCRDFGRRMSLLLERLEDMEEYRMADRVMDVMAGCSPKEGSHCENALATRARLESLKERARDMLDKCE